MKSDRDGTHIWLANADTTLTYRWKGEVFDSVAHGNGVLCIIDNGKIIEEKSATAYYGALVKTDIVNISDRENYVGELNNDRFHGYGVYNKNGEIYIGHFRKILIFPIFAP